MSVVIIGNFDGVHLGHRKLVAAAKAEAESLGDSLFALTFEPHPKDVLGGGVKLITPFALKEKLLLSCGVDRVVSVKFDRAFASLSAEEFLAWLKKDFGCKTVVCGENSHFGKGGAVSSAQLATLAEKEGIRVEIISVGEENAVSSSRIRELISAGKIAAASELLGHPFSVFAPVVSGNRIGRTIGFPTVNQPLDESLVIPPFGVYVASVQVDGKEYPAVSNIGVKPTVGNCPSPLIETHLLDVDISGFVFAENLCVDLYQMLRPEIKFGSLDELKAQIALDSELAQKYFH